jgi:type I restriction enzyme, R subunit
MFHRSARGCASVGSDRQTKADVIRRQGNAAVHKARRVTANEALQVLAQLFHVLYWLARHYSRDPADLPPAARQFDSGLVPRPMSAQVRIQRQAELQEKELRFAEQDRLLAPEKERSDALEAELSRLRAEVAAAKAANEARPDDHDYDEAATRDLFIDLLLREAGWTLESREDREYPVIGMPNQQGTGFVDYVLWGPDGNPLGVVEAKRTRRDPTVGQQQAKLYADCLEAQFGQRPVIFYTNGYEHWIWDDTGYPPRRVEGFLTRDELGLMVQRRRTRKTLAELPVNEHIVERHYQQRAIRRISDAFEVDRQRQALVVMATGAGKTRTVIALVDLLMRANWVKRVLFLVDRVALVNQAVNAFKTQLADATTVNLVNDRTTDGRIYVSTYPTIMGLINEGAGEARHFGVLRSGDHRRGAPLGVPEVPGDLLLVRLAAGWAHRDTEGRGRPEHLSAVPA